MRRHTIIFLVYAFDSVGDDIPEDVFDFYIFIFLLIGKLDHVAMVCVHSDCGFTPSDQG